MNERSKLILALMQVESLSKILENNDWEQFFVSHLIPIKVELERQLSLVKNS